MKFLGLLAMVPWITLIAFLLIKRRNWTDHMSIPLFIGVSFFSSVAFNWGLSQWI